MSSMYFGVYRDDVMRLARSVVIKFSEIANQINERLKEVGHEADPARPETWKYYQNLAGEYHETDVMMTVRSADTLEIIDFTKENLALHRATAREYIPGSVLYNSLVRQFPEQAGLITGILYPIDIQTAIDSNDGDILYFDPKYVEDNEYSFFHQLQSWVNVFITRWYNPQFNLTDDLYLANFLGHLYTRLPIAIMLIRLRNAKTNEAHSYHVTEYLASHQGLDEFIPYLSLEQRLWLYRNIAFLERNAGKKEIWQRLIKNILTPRGIPLISFTIEQNSSKMPEQHRPTVDMIKHDVNFPVVQEGQETTSVADVLEREDDLARENPLVRFDAEQDITDKMSSDQYSWLRTKVLDSEVIDRSNSSVRSLMSVLLNEWLHLASSDKYRAYVQIPNPKTGEFMTMTVKDAFIVMMYTYAKARDIPTDNIPSLVAYEVLRDKLPTFGELRPAVDKRIIPDRLITAVQDMVTPMGNYISTEQFYLDCVRLHKEYLLQWEMYSFQEHPAGRAYCEQLVKFHYMHRMCKLAPPNTKFEDYFRRASFDILNLNKTEAEQMCMDCINIATGSNLVRVITLGEVQRELLRLMGRLSSYPLQYLRNVSFTDFHILGMVMPRVGDIAVDAAGNYICNVAVQNVKAYRTSAGHTYRVVDDSTSPFVDYVYSQQDMFWINPFVEVRDLSYADAHYYIPVNGVNVSNVVIETNNSPNTTGDLDQYQNSTDPNWPKLKE